MWFLYLLSIISLIVQAVFVTLAFAAGLYYLAELVEEYTVLAKSIISWTVAMTAAIHLGLILFEDIPLYMNALGLTQQVLHCLLLREFPAVRVTSVSFLAAVATLIAHHYYAIKYFGQVYYTFGEVLSYFTLCLWLVPFALFVSLSANDYVLPTTGEKQPLLTAGLYYLAELVEEYTVLAKSIISWTVAMTAAIHLGLILFEDIPLYMNALGLTQQVLHCLLLREFPAVRVTSVSFLAAVATLIAHHYYAIKYFGQVYYTFGEVLSYFTLCLWLVPFALFVSLSANDYVLPTTGEKQPLLSDNNVVTDYLSRKSKRYSLLAFFSFAKDSLLPQRTKKAF